MAWYEWPSEIQPYDEWKYNEKKNALPSCQGQGAEQTGQKL